jgi:hypothetical protein
MAIRKKIREKPGRNRTAESDVRTKSRYAVEEKTEELSPLDIIKQDTDMFSEESQQMFTLPAPSMEISDYYAYFLIPSEDIKAQSVRSIR